MSKLQWKIRTEKELKALTPTIVRNWNTLIPVGPTGYSHLHDERLRTILPVTVVKHVNDSRCQTFQFPIWFVFAYLLYHQVGHKNGTSYIFALVDGTLRRQDDVLLTTYIAIDCDTGESFEYLCDAVRRCNWLAIILSSHSHLKTSVSFSLKRCRDYCRDNGLDPADLQNSALINGLMAAKGYQQEIVAGAAYSGTDDKNLVVSTPPISRHRIVMPMSYPFEVGVDGDAAIWKHVLLSVATALGVTPDEASTDLKRLNFGPRHNAGAAFNAGLFGGDMVDFHNFLPAEGVLSRDIDGAHTTPIRTLKPYIEVDRTLHGCATDGGEALMDWIVSEGRHFDPVVWIEDFASERIIPRGRRGPNKTVIRCIFEDLHSEINDDDEACAALNKRRGSWNIKCHHDSCSNMDRLDHIAALKEQYDDYR